MVIYKNKEKPWKSILTRVANFEKSLFFYWNPAPNNHWMWKPRGFLWFNLFLLSFWRDNSKIQFGLGFGKKHYCLVFRH